MFSLVITIVSIALVAALAIATIYYGGSAFNRASSDADAVKLKSQGDQILSAMVLYRADHGVWPTDQAQLLNPDAEGRTYLKSWPTGVVAQGQLAVVSAFATTGTWELIPGKPAVKYTSNVSEDVCRSVNRLARGDNGIMAKLSTKYGAQCFAPLASASYTVVIAQNPGGDLEAVSPGNVVDVDAPVSDTASDLWNKPPAQASNPSGPGDSSSVGNLSFYPITFNNVSAGLAQSRTLTLVNSGAGPLTITGVNGTIAGGTLGVDGSNCLSDGLLLPNQFCSVVVTYSTANPQAATGSVTITTNNGASSAYSVAVHTLPRVTPPVSETEGLSYVSSVLFEPSQAVQTMSKQVTLTNTGSDNVYLSGFYGNFPSFYVVDTSECEIDLPAGQSCNIHITFNAFNPTPLSREISFYGYRASTDSSVSYTLTVGNSSVGGASVDAIPAYMSSDSLSLADTSIGSSTSSTISLLNSTYDAPVKLVRAYIEQPATSGENVYSFQLEGCSEDAMVSSDTGCGFTVTASPKAAGLASGTLKIEVLPANSAEGTYTLSVPLKVDGLPLAGGQYLAFTLTNPQIPRIWNGNLTGVPTQLKYLGYLATCPANGIVDQLDLDVYSNQAGTGAAAITVESHGPSLISSLAGATAYMNLSQLTPTYGQLIADTHVYCYSATSQEAAAFAQGLSNSDNYNYGGLWSDIYDKNYYDIWLNSNVNGLRVWPSDAWTMYADIFTYAFYANGNKVALSLVIPNARIEGSVTWSMHTYGSHSVHARNLANSNPQIVVRNYGATNDTYNTVISKYHEFTSPLSTHTLRIINSPTPGETWGGSN